jgi:hypothetical protein
MHLERRDSNPLASDVRDVGQLGFVSHFGINSLKAIISIVEMLNIHIIASLMVDSVVAGTFFVDLSSPTK